MALTGNITEYRNLVIPSVEYNIFNKIPPGSRFIERFETLMHHTKSNIKFAINLRRIHNIRLIMIVFIRFYVLE